MPFLSKCKFYIFFSIISIQSISHNLTTGLLNMTHTDTTHTDTDTHTHTHMLVFMVYGDFP